MFLAKDVAEWIEYDPNKVNNMVAMVDDHEKLTEIISWSGQGRKMWFLTEDGLYEVLFQSRKPIAKEFKNQVKQILKEIRKRGIYVTDVALENMLSSPDFGIRLLSEIKSEREKIAVLEHKIEEDKPKVDFANAIKVTKDTIYIGDLAKLLQKNGTDIGQTRLFEWLRQNGYLMTTFSRNTPTQLSLESPSSPMSQEKLLENVAKCRQCLFAVLTSGELAKLGSDPCETCNGDLCNWQTNQRGNEMQNKGLYVDNPVDSVCKYCGQVCRIESDLCKI